MASPSISLFTFQYSSCGRWCGNVVSSTSSLSADARNFSSRRGINLRVGPGELQRIHAFLKRDDAGFAHKRDVLAVVNRELDRVALRHRREVDVLGTSNMARAECGR